MTNNPADQYCGDCGKRREPGQEMCPRCGGAFVGTYPGSPGTNDESTQLATTVPVAEYQPPPPSRKPRVLVYKDHEDAGMLIKIERAIKQIDILQVYITNSDTIRPKLQAAFKNGCKIRILILRPGSPYFEDRLKHLATPYLNSRYMAGLSYSMLKGLDEELAQKPNPLGASLEIKVYDFIPYFPYYRIDDHVFIGFFLKDGSHLSPQIHFYADELERSGTSFSKILPHFDEFWDLKGNKYLKELGDFESLAPSP